MEERVLWIDVKAVNVEKIITSEETPNAIAPMIYNVSGWIDGENVFVEDD